MRVLWTEMKLQCNEIIEYVVVVYPSQAYVDVKSDDENSK